MTERPRFFDDLAGVAGGALSAVSGLRDEMSSLVRARVDETIRRLDLVRREEFDSALELASKARADAEMLADRVARLEAMVIPAAPREIEPTTSEPDESVGAENNHADVSAASEDQVGNTST